MIMTFIITFIDNYSCNEKNLLLQFEKAGSFKKELHFLNNSFLIRK